MNIRTVWLTLACSAWACHDGGASADPFDLGAADVSVAPDGAATDAAVPDAAPPDAALDGAADAAPADAGPSDASPDAWVQCTPRPPGPPAPSGPLPEPESAGPGVDVWETAAWDRFREVALADPGVHFVATYLRPRAAFVVETATARLVFRRGPQGDFEVIEGAVADVFPRTEAARFGDLPSLLAAFDRTDAPDRQDQGYAPNNPRIGWLPAAEQSWPAPLLRIATLFDAENAPDLVAGLWPWASGATSTHGGLGLLQSRSTLVISGYGARQGVVLDEVAHLVDAAPTVLAALGAPTTGGIGPDGMYDDGLFLLRQDGRVLWEALDPDPCVTPEHVVFVLFDGLLANEINHQMLAEAPDVALPTFRALAAQGAVYRHGAVSGFPSVSAPGHMTAGTGVWPGHHGVVANVFLERATQTPLNPFALVEDPGAFLADPSGAFEFYDRAVDPGVETLAAAAHRALGRFDPETGEGAYVVVINELTIGDADYTTLDYIGGGRAEKASLEEYGLADNLALVQAKQVIGSVTRPVPTILQLALVATDRAGESAGPHSPLTREVLLDMERRMGELVASLDRNGALERTLFVLVSDHGMELQDPARTARLSRSLATAGLRFGAANSGLFYLRTLEATHEAHARGLTVRVVNHDTGAPVEGATVTCAGCPEATTDAQGRAELPPAAEVEIAHPDFNPLTLATE